MHHCFFVTDLHGRIPRYRQLFEMIEKEPPGAVFLGGDLMPSGMMTLTNGAHLIDDFFHDFLQPEFSRLRNRLGPSYPEVFIILGNDDRRCDEILFQEEEKNGLWHYMHNKQVGFGPFRVYGYACVPPTPFLLKDWERYDVSRYVDPGCVPPEEGYRTVEVHKDLITYSTIQNDLAQLTGDDDLSNAIFLFHTPPYQTHLDRAALDGKKIEHVPLDVHVGSIAVKRFLEDRNPLISLHGHVHESARITGHWQDRIGQTHALSAAHDGPELALVRFSPDTPETCDRLLLPA
jgi:Icc-related predicted phosphoesterase